MIGRQSCLSVLGVVFCTPVCARACVTKLPHQKDLPHRHLGCALFIFYYFIINVTRVVYIYASQFLPRAGSWVLGFIARRTPTGSSEDHNT